MLAIISLLGRASFTSLLLLVLYRDVKIICDSRAEGNMSVSALISLILLFPTMTLDRSYLIMATFVSIYAASKRQETMGIWYLASIAALIVMLASAILGVLLQMINLC